MGENDSTLRLEVPERNASLEADTLSEIVRALQALTPEGRQRVLAAVSVFLGISLNPGYSKQISAPDTDPPSRSPRFSEDRTPSPKEFLHEKRPQTDVDRIACLAYYLAHYLGTPHFKTLDLSKLNTEAAQLKFSNAAKAVENATRAGLLVQALKGAKQLSALGELYVQALPDKDAARSAVAHARRPRKKSRKGGSKGQAVTDDFDSIESATEE